MVNQTEVLAEELRKKTNEIDLHNEEALERQQHLDDMNKDLADKSADIADLQKQLEQLKSVQEKIVTQIAQDDKKRKWLENEQGIIAKKMRLQHKETDTRRQIDSWEDFVYLVLTWLLPPFGSYMHEPDIYHSGRRLRRVERFCVLRLVNKAYAKAVTQYTKQSVSPLYVVLPHDTWRFANATKVDIEDFFVESDGRNHTTVTVHFGKRRMQMGPIKRYLPSFSLLVRLQDDSGYGVVCATFAGIVFLPYAQNKYGSDTQGMETEKIITTSIAPELANCELAQMQLLTGEFLRICFQDNQIRNFYTLQEGNSSAVTVKLWLDVTLLEPVLHIEPARIEML